MLRRHPRALPNTDRSGLTCRKHGHLTAGQTTPWLYCKRCEFTIHAASGDVLYFGKFHRKVPAHDEAAEQRNAEWAKDYVARQIELAERMGEARVHNDQRKLDELELELAKLTHERRRAFGIEP